MQYTKNPTDIPDQLAKLKLRGLEVEDEQVALRQLAVVSYFRLANYWNTFEVNSTTHEFVPGTTLQKVVSLYSFDRDLRGIVFSAIQDVEIALRTQIIHHFSMSHGSFWFMDETLFAHQDIFQKCLSNLRTEVHRSREKFIQEYFDNYDSPSMPPVWKTLEVASFGTLSNLYCNIKDVLCKKAVAASFGLPQYKYLESWMRCLTVLRNYCAHHARLWNRRFPWKPLLPSKLPSCWIDVKGILPIKLYVQLSALLYLGQGLTPQAEVKRKLLNLLEKQPDAYLKAMGFPTSWRDQELWKFI